MKGRYLSIILFSFIHTAILAQVAEDEAYRKTFRSELKIVESKLSRRPNDPTLNYKYGLLLYKLCRYRDAQRVLNKCKDAYSDNAYYFLDLYHVEQALKNQSKAQEYYSTYKSLSEKNSGPSSIKYLHREYSSEVKPIVANNSISSMEFYPYVLNNDKIKYLTISEYEYSEPSSPLLYRNFMTNEVVFSNPEFSNKKVVNQPERISEGFSYYAFCLNKAQDRLYMTRFDGNNKRMIICVSDKKGLSWSPFRMVRNLVNSPKASFMHPMLTENEDQLIFSSDMAGGYGGLDLWIADLNEAGEVRKVRNMGSEVNTIGNECFPSLYTQQHFFFSSDGHYGYGSLDLFKCDLSNNQGTNIVNLGPSFNSERDEYGLFYSLDSKTGYFTSNRSFSNANLYVDKIYKIKLNVLGCQIIDLEISNPINSQSIVKSNPIEHNQQNIAAQMSNTVGINIDKNDVVGNTISTSSISEINNSYTIIEKNGKDPIQPVIHNTKSLPDITNNPTINKESLPTQSIKSETYTATTQNSSSEEQNKNNYAPKSESMANSQEIDNMPPAFSANEVERAIKASAKILDKPIRTVDEATTINDSEDVSKSSKPSLEKIELYSAQTSTIQEKFISYDNTSISNLKTELIVENKFWTTAKLWFKEFNLPIGFSFIRVINPRNEVVYSNYSSENGMISVEVVESNEYTIEIPRFKTILKGVKFAKEENNLYFDYIDQTKTEIRPSSNQLPKSIETSKLTTNLNAKKNRPKKLITKNSTIIKSPSPKTAAPGLAKPKTKTKPAPEPKRKNNKKPENKSAPRNMIDNFS